MSTAKQAITDLKASKIWPVYFLYGDEPFKVHEFIQMVTEAVFPKDQHNAYNIERIDGSVSTGDDVISSLQSMGLFSGAGRKVVLVKQASQLKEADELADMIMKAKPSDNIWSDSLLILVSEGLDGRKKFHQWLKKSGYALEFARVKDSELLQWVGYIAKKLGIKTDADAAQSLAIVSDGSLVRLAQELEKAWLHSGADNATSITQKDVAAIANAQITHEMNELVSAIMEKKKIRSLILCDKLIKNSSDAIGLVGFLTWAIKNPRVAMGGGFGGSNRGYNPYSSQNTKAVSTIESTRLLDALIELDLKLKSSGLEPKTLVENLVLELCAD